MSEDDGEGRSTDVPGEAQPLPGRWETVVAMGFLWVIPAAAFVLVMLQVGAHGPT